MNKIVREYMMSARSRFTPDDTRGLRDALGQFATGVTIVTAQTEDGPIGMTANSFSSVSLEPPLVLWSVGKSASRHDIFAKAERFSINVLASEQAPVAKAFVKDGQAFTDENSVEVDGLRIIRDALATFECALHTTFDGGDHTIVLGKVTHLTLGDGAPLVFHRGGFGSFFGS